jgi:hypothetical protein
MVPVMKEAIDLQRYFLLTGYFGSNKSLFPECLLDYYIEHGVGR